MIRSVYLPLSRVWEEWKDSSDPAGRSNLAGRNCNEKLNKVVIYLATSRLNDEDIFSSDGFSDLDSGLSDCKFSQVAFRRWDSQVVANCLCKLGVGTSTEYANISNHALCLVLCLNFRCIG